MHPIVIDSLKLLLYIIILSLLNFVILYFSRKYDTKRVALISVIYSAILITTLGVASFILTFKVMTKSSIEMALYSLRGIPDLCRTENIFNAILLCNNSWDVYYGICDNAYHIAVKCNNMSFGFYDDCLYIAKLRCNFNGKSVSCFLS